MVCLSARRRDACWLPIVCAADDASVNVHVASGSVVREASACRTDRVVRDGGSDAGVRTVSHHDGDCGAVLGVVKVLRFAPTRRAGLRTLTAHARRALFGLLRDGWVMLASERRRLSLTNAAPRA
jgi:hypothetical protein